MMNLILSAIETGFTFGLSAAAAVFGGLAVFVVVWLGLVGLTWLAHRLDRLFRRRKP
jgi:hypothetical protein